MSAAPPSLGAGGGADEHHGTFGPDGFGRGAEHAARFFGTPQ